MLQLLREPLVESVGAVETEDATAAGVRLQEGCEASLYARALVLERQRSARRSQIVRHAFAVLSCLEFDARQRGALFLGLHNSDGCAINEKKIVGLAVARLQRKLAHSDTAASGQIGRALALDNPASA